ncbi:ALKBH4 [Cordylochernes scorpioides]|uniref:ALKBH4 n=1 Tax=Cordylochernes scorpioides TaxID=51811 RepID=A0ABY6KRE4_9ARAC|nr:ALKBH4 [Cordylochernes scorpioides]
MNNIHNLGVCVLQVFRFELCKGCRRFHCGRVTLEIEGVTVVPDFISAEEEDQLVDGIDQIPWVPSQSGRYKQDFGPKVNFKKKKVRCGTFNGLPEFTRWLVERLRTVNPLADFRPVELCHLDYSPARGAAIDPHLDDFWLWGDRLVTVNLLGDTVLTLTPVSDTTPALNPRPCSSIIEADVPMPRRSLVIISGEARSQWYHGIHRANITSRRLAMTFRELSRVFSEGGPEENVGNLLLEKARNYF